MPLDSRTSIDRAPSRRRLDHVLTARRGASWACGALVFLTVSAATTHAQGAAETVVTHDTVGGSHAWIVALLGTQIDVIGQALRPFHSTYAGANSLSPDGDHKISHAYGAYLGAQIGPRVQAYLDVEMVRGKGISHVTGLAGPTNGDVLREGTVNLGNGPYVARAFVRATIPFAGASRDTLAATPDQMPSVASGHRIEITVGKLAVNDLFDLNRYANNPRQQFMNWGLFQNTAWDFAADTRGYTNGVSVAWIMDSWSLRIGSFQMPREANGNVFDSDLRRARGDQAEVTYTMPWTSTTVRVLGYINHARMGVYADALAQAAATHTTPDIVADDRPDRRKIGWGLNLEQPLADSGNTGLFARVGWNDGTTESFAFTEVEQHVSAGLQLSGASWGRRDDRCGIAGVRDGIGTVHREYLAAGGIGFLLGDGALRYGNESVAEVYYRAQLGPMLQIGPDVQYIKNPGYNRDRGPATVLSARLNLRY